VTGGAETVEIATPAGRARALVETKSDAAAALILGHGAGGGVEAPDLVRARDVALQRGLAVVRVEQPYRVAGRRSPPAAPQLDVAWIAVCGWLREERLHGMRLVTGGRSSGARVACRTASEVGASAVLCLAFPLRPPGRLRNGAPRPDRLGELDAVDVPVLVIQGERDRFGMPPAAPDRDVAVVAADHGLKSDLAAVGRAIETWLAKVV
jgi:predicted alpha/beta-hydrolase family hydrolase